MARSFASALELGKKDIRLSTMLTQRHCNAQRLRLIEKPGVDSEERASRVVRAVVARWVVGLSQIETDCHT
jgi:hypothetical protein